MFATDILYTLTVENATKPAKGTKESKGSKTAKSEELEARDSARNKVDIAAEQIQGPGGMLCKRTNHIGRVCYKKWNGECGTYTPVYILEHAKLLVSPRNFVLSMSANKYH